MAEAEIQILIKAVDEMSDTLKNIEGKLEGFSDEAQQQSKKTGEAFNKSTNSLIALGNAASTVDNIFDSYNNMQLRLENSNERLANAQDRLKDAQYNLNKVMQDSESTSEDIAHAQDQVTRAARGLTIAENNLARTQNQVTGTYINMGVQITSLIGSIPTLFTSLMSLGVPGLIILGVAAAIAAIYYAIKNNEQLQAMFKQVWDQVKLTFEELMLAVQPLIPYIKILLEVIGVLAFFAFQGLAVILQVVSMAFQGWVGIIVTVIDYVKTLVGWVQQLVDWISKISYGAIEEIAGFFAGGKNTNQRGRASSGGDMIIKPDGSVVRTDPRDTLVAFKEGDKGVGGGGMTIVIEGNVYGTDPTEMAEEIWRIVRRKISI